METSASFEARYAPLLYPTNHVEASTHCGAKSANRLQTCLSQRPVFRKTHLYLT